MCRKSKRRRSAKKAKGIDATEQAGSRGEPERLRTPLPRKQRKSNASLAKARIHGDKGPLRGRGVDHIGLRGASCVAQPHSPVVGSPPVGGGARSAEAVVHLVAEGSIGAHAIIVRGATTCGGILSEAWLGASWRVGGLNEHGKDHEESENSERQTVEHVGK